MHVPTYNALRRDPPDCSPLLPSPPPTPPSPPPPMPPSPPRCPRAQLPRCHTLMPYCIAFQELHSTHTSLDCPLRLLQSPATIAPLSPAPHSPIATTTTLPPQASAAQPAAPCAPGIQPIQVTLQNSIADWLPATASTLSIHRSTSPHFLLSCRCRPSPPSPSPPSPPASPSPSSPHPPVGAAVATAVAEVVAGLCRRLLQRMQFPDDLVFHIVGMAFSAMEILATMATTVDSTADSWLNDQP